MNILIQSATPRNAAVISALTQELGYATNVAETTERLHFLLASPMHQVFLALVDNALCGWLVVEKRMTLESGFRAEITGLIVGSSYRRLGVGQQLVKAAEEWSRDLGLSHIAVRSNIKRPESHSFYQSVGFQLKKTVHAYAKPLD